MRERRPARLRESLSSGVSSLRGLNDLPILTFSPPSHQFARPVSKISRFTGSAGGFSREVSSPETSLILFFSGFRVVVPALVEVPVIQW